MEADALLHMEDEEPRALLTGRERNILLGDADVSEKYYYVVVTRVRKRIKQLESDIPALNSHNSLGDELREIVCNDTQNSEN